MRESAVIPAQGAAFAIRDPPPPVVLLLPRGARPSASSSVARTLRLGTELESGGAVAARRRAARHDVGGGRVRLSVGELADERVEVGQVVARRAARTNPRQQGSADATVDRHDRGCALDCGRHIGQVWVVV